MDQILRWLAVAIESRWWFSCLVLTALVLSTISLTPLDMDDKENNSASAFIATRLRRIGLLLALLCMVPPATVYIASCFGTGSAIFSCVNVTAFLLQKAKLTIPPVLSAIGLGITVRFCWARYVETYWSHITRKFRFKVADERLSDIRDVAGKIVTKQYDPSKYYDPKGDRIFIGVDAKNKPIYIQTDKLRKTHAEVIGPTGVGKGIVVGVILDQFIAMNKTSRKSNVVIAIMPKQDLYLPHIMKQRAEEAGCRFMFFDMNPGGEGQWAPFSGGSSRERRSRIMSVLGMGETGKLDDFYKLGEKSLIDSLLQDSDFSVSTLRAALEAKTDSKGGLVAKRSVDTLKEIELVDTFACKKDRGIKLERILTQDKPTVLYVNSSLTDSVIIKMTKAFILEITQLAISLKSQGRRSSHLTLFCDELRFLISDEFDKALATLAMYDTNVISAYQSPQDLEKVGDDNLNGPAIAHSVHTNNQIKLLYRIGEQKQAEWAAGQTGKQYKTIASREATEVDQFGAEKWGDSRMLEQKEEWYYTENLFQALPERVGVLIEPGEKARVIYTCFVPVEQKDDFYTIKPKEISPTTEKGDKPKIQRSKTRSKSTVQTGSVAAKLSKGEGAKTAPLWDFEE